ncbi:MAG: hypothetical protein RLZZ437_163 [Pseudomonadota bacterium]|jgi:hypothetical protein
MTNSFAQVRALLQQMVALLNADDYAGLANYYDFPFMMEMEDTAVLFNRPDEAMAAWANFRSVMRQLGIHSSDIRVVAVELPRMARQRVWIEFMHFDIHGQKLRSADLTLYFRLRPQKMTLVMQHVTRQSVSPHWAITGP